MIFQVVTLRSMICLVAGRPRDSLLSGENGKGGINTPSMYIYIYTRICVMKLDILVFTSFHTHNVYVYIYIICVWAYFF